jgi:hypothetical protein
MDYRSVKAVLTALRIEGLSSKFQEIGSKPENVRVFGAVWAKTQLFCEWRLGFSYNLNPELS